MAQSESAKPNQSAPPGEHAAEVVYRRTEPDGATRPKAPPPVNEPRPRVREIAPAITPLVIGFTLLLALISILGYLSVQRMNEVSNTVISLEQAHTARLRLLLDLRVAVTKLNTEARRREEVKARGELNPPFEFPLGTAREEVARQLRKMTRLPLAEDPSWKNFYDELETYVEITKVEREYSLKGFPAFRKVDEDLTGLLTESASEQFKIADQREALEQQAVRSIRRWSVFALLVGFVVAAGTVWEVQRRFSQMRISMLDAGRERAFTNQLLEGMVSAVAAIDEQDHLRSANAAFFKIFPAASIGASIHEKFAPNDAMKMLEAATSVRATMATYRGRWVCGSAATHSEKTFDVYTSPLAINDDHGQIVTLVDATEAADSERSLRRSESLAAVGQATAQVAHEIRNPLGSIRLGVSMLRDSITDADALNTIELVERGIRHLNKLVVDVTQFSRQKALERSRVDLQELLDVSLDLVSESVREKQTPIERKSSPESLVGNWDGHQLRQVFVNLMSNAIEA
ncbi:MAG TPA: histidine kinase dimerization/phospho-acceptor domain-containing protein, partial [Pyrinomonadaceae bacterium]|nr:histidine kinase dimerization/phospho-acceptor domain-containing protein [Pyrinomonadaceae bacterium]